MSEPMRVGLLLPGLLRDLADEVEATAGPLRGTRSGRPERSGGPQRERAQRVTAQPERQGPEAGGSEALASERPEAGRRWLSDVRCE